MSNIRNIFKKFGITAVFLFCFSVSSSFSAYFVATEIESGKLSSAKDNIIELDNSRIFYPGDKNPKTLPEPGSLIYIEYYKASDGKNIYINFSNQKDILKKSQPPQPENQRIKK
jgi:hypothetical protein